MKKLLYVRLVVMTTSLFISAASSAQSSADIARVNSPATATYSASADAMVLAGLKSSNAKMYNHFTKHFKNATDLNVRSNDEGSRINFKLNGISTSSQYDSKGKFQFSISHYDESLLSDKIREDVEAAYPGFLVFGTVIDVKVLDKSAKLVMIENKKEWKRIRITNEGMSIYEEFKKQ